MRPVSVFANGPGSEIEQLQADLHGRWWEAAEQAGAAPGRAQPGSYQGTHTSSL